MLQIKEKLHYYSDGKVYLQLQENGRLFYLGFKNGDEFISYKKQKDLFRKNNSFAYNYQLISEGNFKILHTIFNKISHYYISREDVLRFGKLMHFKSQGQEKQIFVPMNAFHKSVNEALKLKSNEISFSNPSFTKPLNFGKGNCTQIPLFS